MNPKTETDVDMALLQAVEKLDDQAAMISNVMGVPLSRFDPVSFHQMMHKLFNANRDVREVLLHGRQEGQDSPGGELEIPGL